MTKSIYAALVSLLAACGLAAGMASQASAANLKEVGVSEPTGFQAIYGTPGTNGATVPVGGGLGRNFGFGASVLFEACTNCATPVGKNLSVTFATNVAQASESFLGGTLMSNKTGANNPLGLTIHFVDLQDWTLGGSATPTYTDTADRPWIAGICSPSASESACKTDAQFTEPIKKGGVKIENVSLDFTTAGGSVIYQGTLWGVWENGTTTHPPCIQLEKPAAGNPTLAVTQTYAGGPTLGALAEAVKGQLCAISINNNYYKVRTSEEKTPAIEIANE